MYITHIYTHPFHRMTAPQNILYCISERASRPAQLHVVKCERGGGWEGEEERPVHHPFRFARATENRIYIQYSRIQRNPDVDTISNSYTHHRAF